MKKTSRRDFLRLTGFGFGVVVLQACGGGGGGSTNEPDPSHFQADRSGSILDVTTDVFGVTTQFDQDLNDYKVVNISWHGQSLLAGSSLVFEINNGGELVGDNVSATRTQVNAGDTIRWLSLA